jgi:predicted transcriptional regulator
MSPAERLAANKQRKRPKRNSGIGPRTIKLRCTARAMRESLNLSLRDVATSVGISVSGLHAVEYGCDVQITTALRLCEFYGCGLESLWGAMLKRNGATEDVQEESK